jgi:hypothetical protein
MLQARVKLCGASKTRLLRASHAQCLDRLVLQAVRGMLCLSLVHLGSLCPAADDSKTGERDQRSRYRLELMQSTIDDLQIASKEIQPDSALKPGRTPLLRYNDPTRSLEATTGLLDAGVWRIGDTGRPTALVTLEIYRAQKDKAILSYEFLSLAPAQLVIESPRGPTWHPTGTELKMTRLADAARPADSPKARLVQMRQISRRFSVHQTLDKGEKVECRLLSQPIDRYADEARHIADGAIFVFANGTNPELGLLLECDADDWSYGVARLSAAALFAERDGKPFFEAPQRFNQPGSAPYLGTTHPIAFED